MNEGKVPEKREKRKKKLVLAPGRAERWGNSSSRGKLNHESREIDRSNEEIEHPAHVTVHDVTG